MAETPKKLMMTTIMMVKHRLNKGKSDRSLFRAPDHWASIGCDAGEERERMGGCGNRNRIDIEGSTIVRLAFPGASTNAEGFSIGSTVTYQEIIHLRRFTRCIDTCCLPVQQMWNFWVGQSDARCKLCTRKAVC
ncbi:hypothetical protein DPV78_011601 [Talaromyces pinophilus]|nr:hypothetical protein DPV78_011601 [Talaromyces pinophilus]